MSTYFGNKLSMTYDSIDAESLLDDWADALGDLTLEAVGRGITALRDVERVPSLPAFRALCLAATPRPEHQILGPAGLPAPGETVTPREQARERLAAIRARLRSRAPGRGGEA